MKRLKDRGKPRKSGLVRLLMNQAAGMGLGAKAMSGRVLFVDEYKDALLTWAFFLRMRGFDVRTACDGFSALTIAGEIVPDVIVMDLRLSGIGGCEVARRLRASPRTQSIPIIATTGSSHPSDLDEACAVGFVRIMIKPCEPRRLIEEIERALRAHYVLGNTSPSQHSSAH